MQLREFFRTVITAQEGNFCFAFRGTAGWTEEWYAWPGDLDQIVARAESLRDTCDVYFSTYLFKATSSTKENVLPTRTIQADLDNADVSALPIVPTVLVQTSPGRHQAYWIIEGEPLDAEQHELLSRKLTYAIPLCDRSGWPLGRKVRIPETTNHKYLDGPKAVSIIGASLRTYGPTHFELLPDVPHTASEPYESGFLDKRTRPPMGPQELLRRFQDKIGKCYVQYNTRQPDRSVALWALMCALLRAGASRDEVFHLAQHSANNKFAELRHNGDRELAKDVLRAEQVVRSETLDPRALISQTRRNGGPVNERRQLMLDIVLQFMREQGDFIHTYGGTVFYIRRDSGRPITISKHSDYFEMLLDLQYGLNSVEVDSHFVSAGVYSYSNALPQNGLIAALSHYDPASKFMLLHTGRKDVLQITKDGVSKITDGSYGVVFQWDNSSEPFAPNVNVSPEFDWADFLFSHTLADTKGEGRKIDALGNVVSSSRDEALALLKVWTLFLLFRDLSSARPILATLGQPGSGKTTLFKKLYTVLYGRHRGIGSITNPDDFDHGVANDPFYAIDNVDTWERWLPDRLALSAAVSDIRKRKLYTDADIVTVRRQAMVGISAHNPKFGREDVADRMLIFTFRRLEHFTAEEEILAAVYSRRSDIWGGIIHDVQKIIGTPMVQSWEAPQFRIEDFAKVGVWIARAVGCEDAFRTGLENVKAGQRNFTLEEESLLTVAIRKLVDQDAAKIAAGAVNGHAPEEWRSPGQLWGLLEVASDDVQSFVRAYKNSVFLHKKLWSMQESLKEEFDIQWIQDDKRAGKLWRIKRR